MYLNCLNRGCNQNLKQWLPCRVQGFSLLAAGQTESFTGRVVNLTGCIFCQYHTEFCSENIKCVVRVGSACDPSMRGKK